MQTCYGSPWCGLKRETAGPKAGDRRRWKAGPSGHDEVCREDGSTLSAETRSWYLRCELAPEVGREIEGGHQSKRPSSSDPESSVGLPLPWFRPIRVSGQWPEAAEGEQVASPEGR